MELLLANRERILELVKVLENMDDNIYSISIPILFQSSVGEHVRHIYEFYECLFNSANENVICYDTRNRSLELQTSRELCLKKLVEITDRLHILDLNKELILKTKLVYDSDNFYFSETSIQRELLFILDHTIHHMAIIRIGIESLNLDIKIPEFFGFTPSTVKHKLKVSS
ncbi:MAG: DinB family protein [Leptospiraceae bacterium]|nr:DinB family protein [Leptospiraceae bacterium]